MCTTLTALLWSEGYAAPCHIGDSRAYLLRDGQLVQITHDHTLVQSLVDEGKITEERHRHPTRTCSLLLRALDGRTIAEPDLAPLETYAGDRDPAVLRRPVRSGDRADPRADADLGRRP